MEVREREMGRGEKGINKGERKKKENKRRREQGGSRTDLPRLM